MSRCSSPPGSPPPTPSRWPPVAAELVRSEWRSIRLGNHHTPLHCPASCGRSHGLEPQLADVVSNPPVVLATAGTEQLTGAQLATGLPPWRTARQCPGHLVGPKRRQGWALRRGRRPPGASTQPTLGAAAPPRGNTRWRGRLVLRLFLPVGTLSPILQPLGGGGRSKRGADLVRLNVRQTWTPRARTGSRPSGWRRR
jgi:hypothetical protein